MNQLKKLGVVTLYGDCLDVLLDIPDKSIDMILCDPPYGTTACKWDSIISLQPLWKQLLRITKPNSPIVMTASQPFTTTLISSNSKMFKYCLVWEKNLKTGNLNAKKQPMGGHEDIVVFYLKLPTYNPQKRKRTTEVRSGNKRNSKTSVYGKQKEKKIDGQSDWINPDSIIRGIKCVNRSTGKLHPTQKPVILMEYLIKTYTDKGDTVLDFAAGSFTTAIACINLERKFIGIEKKEEYFNLGVNRIKENFDT